MGIRASTVGSHCHLQTETMGERRQKVCKETLVKRKTTVCAAQRETEVREYNLGYWQVIISWGLVRLYFLTLDIHKTAYYLFKINFFFIWHTLNGFLIPETSKFLLKQALTTLTLFLSLVLNNLKRFLTN